MVVRTWILCFDSAHSGKTTSLWTPLREVAFLVLKCTVVNESIFATCFPPRPLHFSYCTYVSFTDWSEIVTGSFDTRHNFLFISFYIPDQVLHFGEKKTEPASQELQLGLLQSYILQCYPSDPFCEMRLVSVPQLAYLFHDWVTLFSQ